MKKLISFYIILFSFVPFAYATIYNGGLYEIKEGIPTFYGDIDVTLTNNGSSYTLSLSDFDFDNVQMDEAGNLSRDGYVSESGVNYFLLSGYVKEDSLVYRYGMAFAALDPEMIFFTLEFRGKKRIVPTIAEMEEQGLVQAVSGLDYTAAGTWGDSKSVSIQIFDYLWFGSYVCKYNLNAGDFLSVTTAHLAVVVYKGEVQQPVSVLEENGVNRFLFKTGEAGIYYVQITDTPGSGDAS